MAKEFHQAKWNEPLIFELDAPNKMGHMVPEVDADIKKKMGTVEQLLPDSLKRKTPLNLPRVSEVEVVNHYTRLSEMNYGVDLGFYPLGSCTMKYNPKLNEQLASLDKATSVHPLQDETTAQGMLEIMYKLQEWIATLTGTHEVSLQPAAGAHGEFAGILIIRAHHERQGRLQEKTEIIIPDSAHGTNPATASMCGFKVVVVPSNDKGRIDTKALEEAVSERTAGLMLTNPNTLGLFETEIETIASLIHDAGGLLYYDGANLNANLGRVRPGDMGFDVVHVNLHKTFSTPHGGGGPGSGAVGVCKTLSRYLPTPIITIKEGHYHLEYDRPDSIGKVKSFYGNFSVLLKAFTYIMTLGAEGLKESADHAVLCSNYLAKKISKIKGFSLPYAPNEPRKHECVISAEPMLKDKGVSALDVAKRLLDFGLHAPTFYFPMIVHEALMIEPTESFDKRVLDTYIQAFERISKEAYSEPEILKSAPHQTAIGRLDDARASRPKTMGLTWRMLQKVKDSESE